MKANHFAVSFVNDPRASQPLLLVFSENARNQVKINMSHSTGREFLSALLKAMNPASKESESMSKLVADVPWSSRTSGGRIIEVCHRLGIVTVGDILKHSPEDFIDSKLFGKTSLLCLQRGLRSLGIDWWTKPDRRVQRARR